MKTKEELVGIYLEGMREAEKENLDTNSLNIRSNGLLIMLFLEVLIDIRDELKELNRYKWQGGPL